MTNVKYICKKANSDCPLICQHRIPHAKTFQCEPYECTHIGKQVTCRQSLTIDTPITMKEVLKLKVCNVTKTVDVGSDDYNDNGDIDQEVTVSDGVFLLCKDTRFIIALEPSVEMIDQNVAVARIKLRRCSRAEGDVFLD